MKNAKMVLFVMILSAPLSIFGTEFPDEQYSAKDMAATEKASYQKSFKNHGLASVVSTVAFVGSILAQKYAPSDVTRDPKFVLGQAVLVGSAATSGVSALCAARQGYPEYTPASLVSKLWKKADVKPADDTKEGDAK